MAVSTLEAPVFEKADITEDQFQEAVFQLNQTIENEVLRKRNFEVSSLELAKSFRTTV